MPNDGTIHCCGYCSALSCLSPGAKPNAGGEPPPPGTDTRTGTSGRWGRSAPGRGSGEAGTQGWGTRPRSQGARLASGTRPGFRAPRATRRHPRWWAPTSRLPPPRGPPNLELCRSQRPKRPESAQRRPAAMFHPHRPLSSVSISYGHPRPPFAVVGGFIPPSSAFYHVLPLPST